jgi:signal transduction histidine kinase
LNSKKIDSQARPIQKQTVFGLSEQKMPAVKDVNQSLRLKITIGVVIPLIIILGSVTIFDYVSTRNLMLENLSTISSFAGEIVESSIRHEMIENDPEAVQLILDSIASNSDFELLYILKTTGEVIFSPEGVGIGTRLDNTQDECIQCHLLPIEERPESIIIETENGHRVFRSMLPILNRPECYGCHSPDERIRGVLLTDISIDPYNQVLMQDLRRNLVLWGLVIVAVALILYLSLNSFVISRIKQLSNEIEQFTLGIRNPRKHSRNDEIGKLESALYSMVDEIDFHQKENQKLTTHLRNQNKQRGELLTRVITAQEEERKRLARDLHDDLGQTLGGFAFLIEGIEELFQTDPDRAVRQLSEMRKLINESSEKMYDLIMDLRPSILDDLGLVPASKLLAERVLSNKEIKFEIIYRKFPDRLPPEIEISMYRVVQEVLSNCIKHANATKITMEFSCNKNLFKCVISDNGQGFDTNKLIQDNGARGNFGILGMQERITQFGGAFDIKSVLGKGTSIFITIPLKEAEYDEQNPLVDR